MTELLFIGITIFFIYVVFQVIGKQEEPGASKAEDNPAVAPELVKQEPEKQQAAPAAPVAVESKPVSKPATKAAKTAPAKKAPAAPAPASTPATAGDSVKNPKTGEVAKITGNYAFSKRWIKDALVEEGLLDKVYKNNELDAGTTAKIQAALQQLQAMSKYQ